MSISHPLVKELNPLFNISQISASLKKTDQPKNTKITN